MKETVHSVEGCAKEEWYRRRSGGGDEGDLAGKGGR